MECGIVAVQLFFAVECNGIKTTARCIEFVHDLQGLLCRFLSCPSLVFIELKTNECGKSIDFDLPRGCADKLS